MRGISYFRASIKLERKILENQLCYPRMQTFKRGAQHKRKKYNRCSKKEAQCITLYNFIKSKSYLHTTLLKKKLFFKFDVGFRFAKSFDT